MNLDTFVPECNLIYCTCNQSGLSFSNESSYSEYQSNSISNNDSTCSFINFQDSDMTDQNISNSNLLNNETESISESTVNLQLRKKW